MRRSRTRFTSARQTRGFLAALLAVAALALAAPAAPSSADSSGFADALARDSETTLHFRSHALDRGKPGPAESFSWAGGGWLGYRSGWAFDTARLGLTAYTSQKLLGPADQDGAALLLTGQKSYTVLGEAFGALKAADQTFMAGRFLVNRFEVNPQDTRMTPRTFQGAALTGEISGVDYLFGRLDKMKARNWDYFEPVARVAGAPDGVSEPLWLFSVRGAPSAAWTLGFASYQVRDVLVSRYADAAWLTPLGSDTRLRMGGQWMRQGSTGENLLTGAAFDTTILGFKADLIRGPLTLSAIAMQTARGAAYRMPFGSWAGYTSRIINNFNRAGERVRAIDASIDFARLGVAGLMLNASATSGDHAIHAASGAALSKNAEYDITADYRFSAAAWPSWARPLALRARAARFKQKFGGSTDVTTELHLIVNYEKTFK